MRYEYIEPFISSTIRVLDSFIQTDITRGTLALVNENEIRGDVTIFIPLKGETEGNVILNMDQETAINICSVLNGETCEINAIGLDTIAELANMIAGNATSVLNDKGFDFTVFPPTVIVTRDFVRKAPLLEVFQIPLFTEYGEITLNVAMRTQ